ncbi:hypothetical protein EV356DRAFT_552771 [Viridothelium virens]|uniref:Mid2 domain-containing protein n=1 Tax=Viridothelium virens TaxID=1048519 RepID=A0A6A6H0B6_VIRVR|nr:hypothetical protein EV356DRAFT_552771 [Viridothelium virens]
MSLPYIIPSTYPLCLQADLYLSETTTGFLPRINICDDGSYCCDNDPSCCVDKKGALLDATNGEVISFANTTNTSSSTSTSSTSTSVGPFTSYSISVSPLSTPSFIMQKPNRNSISKGAKAGIGVGVASGVFSAILIGLILFSFIKKKPPNQGHISKDSPPTSGESQKPVGAQTTKDAKLPKYGDPEPSAELPATDIQELPDQAHTLMD